MSGAEYIKEWRKTPAGLASLAAQARRAAARRAAVQRLVQRHAAEFETMLHEELQRVEKEYRRGRSKAPD